MPQMIGRIGLKWEDKGIIYKRKKDIVGKRVQKKQKDVRLHRYK